MMHLAGDLDYLEDAALEGCCAALEWCSTEGLLECRGR